MNRTLKGMKELVGRLNLQKPVEAARNPLDALRRARSIVGFSGASVAPFEFLIRLTGVPREELQAYYWEALSHEELRIAFQLADRIQEESEVGTGLVGNVSKNDAAILYTLVRLYRPKVVVETGVAAGVSSTAILLGLEGTGGQLCSIDLPPEAVVGKTLDDGLRYDPAFTRDGPGWIIPARLKKEWHLILGDVRTSLLQLLRDCGTIDLFFHDDLHTPQHMLWELALVWPFLHDGGWLVVDDITYGYTDFLKKLKLAVGTDLYLNCGGLAAVQKKLI